MSGRLSANPPLPLLKTLGICSERAPIPPLFPLLFPPLPISSWLPLCHQCISSLWIHSVLALFPRLRRSPALSLPPSLTSFRGQHKEAICVAAGCYATQSAQLEMFCCTLKVVLNGKTAAGVREKERKRVVCVSTFVYFSVCVNRGDTVQFSYQFSRENYFIKYNACFG